MEHKRHEKRYVPFPSFYTFCFHYHNRCDKKKCISYRPKEIQYMKYIWTLSGMNDDPCIPYIGYKKQKKLNAQGQHNNRNFISAHKK